MRRRMAAGHPNRTALFDLKHDSGGMVDVEFAVQYLVLAHAGDHAALTRNVGNIALLRMAGELSLVPSVIALGAADAYRDYRRAQHQIRLTGAPHARVEPGTQTPRRAPCARYGSTCSAAVRGAQIRRVGGWPADTARRAAGGSGKIELWPREPRHVDGRPRRLDLVRRQDGAVARGEHARAHAHASLRTRRLRGRARVQDRRRRQRSSGCATTPTVCSIGTDLRHEDPVLEATSSNAAQLACVRDNRLESCYIRPIVLLRFGAMGVRGERSNPVKVAIAAWPWGAYLGADGLENGHSREDVVVHAPSRQHHDV